MQIILNLLMQINSSKKKTGVIAPKRFVQRVKKQNEFFRSYMHQVLNFIVNFMVSDVKTFVYYLNNRKYLSLANVLTSLKSILT